MPTRFTVALAVLAGLVLGASPLAAEEIPVVARGTDGLTRVPFTAANAGAEAIACSAATAHWFSVDLGMASPGASVRATLWASAASGEIFVLNDKQDRMPLLNLWCGLAGRTWATRSTVRLERMAGTAPEAIALSCNDAVGTLVCH